MAHLYGSRRIYSRTGTQIAAFAGKQIRAPVLNRLRAFPVGNTGESCLLMTGCYLSPCLSDESGDSRFFLVDAGFQPYPRYHEERTTGPLGRWVAWRSWPMSQGRGHSASGVRLGNVWRLWVTAVVCSIQFLFPGRQGPWPRTRLS